ncbi:MAG: glycosyl hydrolase family 28 protein [Melioribacteraceae bacterium]|nr:glycosyl hydrolase family 28 protein [Melioribacteraceae bacterium]
MKKLLFILFFQVSIVFGQSVDKFFHSIDDFGAKGDGVTLNTIAIQNAIDKCSENGGTVIIPKGIYLTGSLELKSNTDIYLMNGALLLGSTQLKDYKEFLPQLKSYNDSFLRYSIFYAERVSNISIRGEGTIDGQGESFKVTTKEKPERYKNRPYIIRFVECSKIKIEGIRLQNSAMWMQQYLGCKDVTVKGISVFNHANPNNDMIDIDGCSNFIMSDCFGDSDDDAITIKSTSPYVSENITITNCVVSSHCNAFKLGTESTGGFRNITVSNIVIKPSSVKTTIYGTPGGISGITLGAVDGGPLENITISNIVIEGVQVPFYLRLGNRGRKYTPDAPQPGISTFKNVFLSNIIATKLASNIGASITGVPDNYIENVTLSNIYVEYPGGGNEDDASKKLDELIDHYPESTMWETLPAYGVFIRHAKNITMNNVRFNIIEKDMRPAIILDDVEGITINDFETNSLDEKIKIENSRFLKGNFFINGTEK